MHSIENNGELIIFDGRGLTRRYLNKPKSTVKNLYQSQRINKNMKEQITQEFTKQEIYADTLQMEILNILEELIIKLK